MRMTTIVVALVALAAGAAQAKPGRCLIEVGGKRYLDGTCNVVFDPDGGMKVGVGTEDSPIQASRYFAYINVYHEQGRASWNGSIAMTAAHDDLGIVKCEGNCWRNSRARICGWTYR